MSGGRYCLDIERNIYNKHMETNTKIPPIPKSKSQSKVITLETVM